MIIEDKVKPYWTEEELAQRYSLTAEQEELADKITEERIGVQLTELLEQYNALSMKKREIEKEIEDRYIKDRKTKGLLADALEIIEAIEKEDFLAQIKTELAQIATLQKEGANESTLANLKELATENYENCYYFILYYLRVQLNGLADHEKETDKVIATVEKRVALWYVMPTPTHFPIPYSKPTDALAYMSGKRAEVNPVTGDATIDRFSVQLRIEKFKDLKANLGISTDKLLSTALAIFAQNNDFHKGSKTATNREVVIPLREYAKLLGYDVIEHETSTPEEAEAEKKRAKNQLDNARKKVKKDLDILYNLSFEWEEIIKGKVESFSSVRLLTAKHYRGGNIHIIFTPEIADHLVERGLITQYNTGMLKLDERKPNAYYIMRKLEEHYNIDANQTNNRHDRIGVKTLLAVTDLASYEEVQEKDRGHWAERIKEPLEESLDYLTQERLLESWEYCHAKGVPLTDEEAGNITNYKDFSKLYLKFTPAKRLDHTGRQEKRKAEREARAKKKKKKS